MRTPLAASIILMVAALSAQATEWKLVWSDEFDTTGLPDKTKWDYEEGFIRNHEEQFYQRERLENSRVEDGMLVIEGRKETIKNPFYKSGKSQWTRDDEFAHYTAASLITLGKASWRYGRIEVRAKLPQGKGVWPAIWMLGTNFKEIGWPLCGEIDIMEFVGHDPNHVHGTVHYDVNGQHTYKGNKIETQAPFNVFHVYAIEWFEDRIDVFLDETKYHTFVIDDAGKGEDNRFRKPFFLMINLALGGAWGGEIDDSIFPQKYLIDYVRVYEQAGPKTP